MQSSQPTYCAVFSLHHPANPLYPIILLSHPFSTPFSSHVLQPSHIHHCTTSLECPTTQVMIQGEQSAHGPNPPSILARDFGPKNCCSLNFHNLCDNFAKKLVSEIRKCCQLQGAKFAWPPSPQAPIT